MNVYWAEVIKSVNRDSLGLNGENIDNDNIFMATVEEEIFNKFFKIRGYKDIEYIVTHLDYEIYKVYYDGTDLIKPLEKITEFEGDIPTLKFYEGAR